jgi:hypothetical protein
VALDRSPFAQRSFAPATPADLEPLLGIQSSQLFVVDKDALDSQYQKQAKIAKAAPAGCQLAQSSADVGICRPNADSAPMRDRPRSHHTPAAG